MKKSNRNIRIFAEKAQQDGSFHIFLDFSGRKEYLVTHRRNPALYSALKNGMSLKEWQRVKTWKPHACIWKGRSRVRQAESVVGHLNAVIRDYLKEREDMAVGGCAA